MLIRLEGGSGRGLERETTELSDYMIYGNETYELTDRIEDGYHIYAIRGRFGAVITTEGATEKQTTQGKRFGIV